MKTLRFFSTALGLVAALALRAGEPAAAAGHVEVIFSHPENFSDVRDMDPGTDKGRDAILSAIREDLVNHAAPMLPAGYTLTLTFTDIHLAGNFEPWRGPNWDQVRIVKDIYPPSFKFAYAVKDPSGRVLKEGSERIGDMDFQDRLTLNTNEPLHYEKAILDDWLRANLRGLKKA